jgi:hypothetical protein
MPTVWSNFFFDRDRRALDDLGRVGVEYVSGRCVVVLGVDNEPIRVHSSHPNKVFFVGLKRAL